MYLAAGLIGLAVAAVCGISFGAFGARHLSTRTVVAAAAIVVVGISAIDIAMTIRTRPLQHYTASPLYVFIEALLAGWTIGVVAGQLVGRMSRDG